MQSINIMTKTHWQTGRRRMLELWKISLSPCSSASVVSMLEHFASRRIQSPIAALAATVFALANVGFVAWYLNETIVQAKIVSDTVLPPLSVVPVVRKPFHNESVYPGQCKPLLRRRVYRHCDQSNVRIRRLLVPRGRFVTWYWKGPGKVRQVRRVYHRLSSCDNWCTIKREIPGQRTRWCEYFIHDTNFKTVGRYYTDPVRQGWGFIVNLPVVQR